MRSARFKGIRLTGMSSNDDDETEEASEHSDKLYFSVKTDEINVSLYIAYAPPDQEENPQRLSII